MTRQKPRKAMIVATATAAAALVILNMVWATSSEGPLGAKPVSLSQLQGETVPAAMTALRAARKALQAGHTDHALAELHTVELALSVTQKTLDTEIGPKFVNATCPIMGNAIRADKVTDDLVRVYQGKRIAFCCDGCPEKWDGLSRIKKVAKLAESLPKPAGAHDHGAHDHSGHEHGHKH